MPLFSSAAAPGFVSNCPNLRLLLAPVAYEALTGVSHPIANAHIFIWPAVSCASGYNSFLWASCWRRFYCRLQGVLGWILLLCCRGTGPFHARILRGGRDRRKLQLCAPNAGLRLRGRCAAHGCIRRHFGRRAGSSVVGAASLGTRQEGRVSTAVAWALPRSAIASSGAATTQRTRNAVSSATTAESQRSGGASADPWAPASCACRHPATRPHAISYRCTVNLHVSASHRSSRRLAWWSLPMCTYPGRLPVPR